MSVLISDDNFEPSFRSIPYIARPNPEQFSHTGKIVVHIWPDYLFIFLIGH